MLAARTRRLDRAVACITCRLSSRQRPRCNATIRKRNFCAWSSRMSDPSSRTSELARLVTDGSAAHRLFDNVMEAFEAHETAVAASEESTGAWTVEIYFEHPPDHDAVRMLVSDLAGDAASERL